ncbi:hypothetical protein ARMSODRAFT_164580 [Armillaria solidipes]|uniref:Uncharacterized protein n=1 Tax=Armillaria solidipes TaxID=1076256 RepID=A0A2H3BF48_9AGAR|nr:hypothetical protein ARMSODRAFT_164580 [Armillaria solidipes]
MVITVQQHRVHRHVFSSSRPFIPSILLLLTMAQIPYFPVPTEIAHEYALLTGCMTLVEPPKLDVSKIRLREHPAPAIYPDFPTSLLPDEVSNYPNLPSSVAVKGEVEYLFCWRKLLKKSDMHMEIDGPVVPLSFLMDEYWRGDDIYVHERHFIFSVSENSKYGTLIHIDYAKDSDEGGMRAVDLLKKLVCEHPNCCIGARL